MSSALNFPQVLIAHRALVQPGDQCGGRWGSHVLVSSVGCRRAASPEQGVSAGAFWYEVLGVDGEFGVSDP